MLHDSLNWIYGSLFSQRSGFGWELRARSLVTKALKKFFSKEREEMETIRTTERERESKEFGLNQRKVSEVSRVTFERIKGGSQQTSPYPPCLSPQRTFVLKWCPCPCSCRSVKWPWFPRRYPNSQAPLWGTRTYLTFEKRKKEEKS